MEFLGVMIDPAADLLSCRYRSCRTQILGVRRATRKSLRSEAGRHPTCASFRGAHAVNSARRHRRPTSPTRNLGLYRPRRTPQSGIGTLHKGSMSRPAFVDTIVRKLGRGSSHLRPTGRCKTRPELGRKQSWLGRSFRKHAACSGDVLAERTRLAYQREITTRRELQYSVLCEPTETR